MGLQTNLQEIISCTTQTSGLLRKFLITFGVQSKLFLDDAYQSDLPNYKQSNKSASHINSFTYILKFIHIFHQTLHLTNNTRS